MTTQLTMPERRDLYLELSKALRNAETILANAGGDEYRRMYMIIRQLVEDARKENLLAEKRDMQALYLKVSGDPYLPHSIKVWWEDNYQDILAAFDE